MSLILTRSKSGGAGVSDPTTSFDIVPAATDTVDIISLPVRIVKWLVVIDELVVGGKNRTYEIMAQFRLDNTVLFTQCGILGDSISHVADVVLVGVNRELHIQNTGSNTIRVQTTRIHAEP